MDKMSNYYEEFVKERKEEEEEIEIEEREGQFGMSSDLQSALADLLKTFKKVLRPRYRTVPYVYKNTTLAPAEKTEVVKEKWEGVLAEVTLLAQSTGTATGVYNQYRIRAVADGQEIYGDTFPNFSTYYNAYMTDVSAFDDGTYYALTFNDIFFDRDMKVTIENLNTDASITFDYIFVKLYKRLGGEFK
jgi:hypothetical protein